MRGRIHMNLQTKLVSVTPSSTKRVIPASVVVAHTITFKHPSGKQFEACLKGAKRKVFAWVNAVKIEMPLAPIDEKVLLGDGWHRVFFNPRKGHRFFQLSDGSRVDRATSAVFIAGTETESGKKYVMGPS